MRRARLNQPVWNFYGLIEQQSLILETYEKHSYKFFVWLPEVVKDLLTKYL